MKLSYIFPKEITFFSVLWYIFLFYFIAYIVINVYLYSKGLTYEIDCKTHDKCFKIKKLGDNTKDKSNNSDNEITQ